MRKWGKGLQFLAKPFTSLNNSKFNTIHLRANSKDTVWTFQIHEDGVIGIRCFKQFGGQSTQFWNYKTIAEVQNEVNNDF